MLPPLALTIKPLIAKTHTGIERIVSTSCNESAYIKHHYLRDPSSVNESRQRLIKFMLSVGATESAAILEQSPAVFVKFDKF